MNEDHITSHAIDRLNFNTSMAKLPNKREIYERIQQKMELNGEILPKTQYQVIFASIVMFIVLFFPCVYGLESLVQILLYDLRNHTPFENAFISIIFTALVLLCVFISLYIILRLLWVVFPARFIVQSKFKELLNKAKLLDGKLIEYFSISDSLNDLPQSKIEFEVFFREFSHDSSRIPNQYENFK